VRFVHAGAAGDEAVIGVEHVVLSASAPGRVCLAGESLDWMTGGDSVTAALSLRTTVTVRTHAASSSSLRLSAGAPITLMRSVRLDALTDYRGDQLDLLQATVAVQGGAVGELLSGAVIETSTRMPVGAGVSSSAALALAATAVLANLVGRPWLERILADAHAAEVGQIRTGAGWMDFLACAHGGLLRISSSADTPAVHHFGDEIGAALVLIDTLQERKTARTLTDKRERWSRKDPDLLDYAKRMPRLVDLLTAELQAPQVDPGAVGDLLNQAHYLLRERIGCSTDLIEECISRALDAGAYGAKLSGSGYGGCLIGIAPYRAIESIQAALATLPVRASFFSRVEPAGVVIHPSGPTI
jgi:mevalonate kinase